MEPPANLLHCLQRATCFTCKELYVKESPKITEEEKGKWLSQCPPASQHKGEMTEAEELPILVV